MFERLYHEGAFHRGMYFNLWVLREEGAAAKEPRVGIVVSRKVSGRATERNLWKRRMREIFRQMKHNIVPGTALLIQAKRKDKVPEYEEIRRDFEKVMIRAGLYGGA